MSKQLSSQKKIKISVIIGVSQQLFTSPKTKGKKDDTTTATPSTPKMNILFSDISNSKTGYYGSLEFLEKQDEFDKVFGKHLLPPNPASLDSFTTVNILLYYI